MIDNKDLIINEAELDQINGGAGGTNLGTGRPIRTEECYCRYCKKNVTGDIFKGNPRPVCPKCRQWAYTEPVHRP